MRYFLHLSYFGKSYHGWQVQENTPRTIQAVLQQGLVKILNETVELTGCGRTDTGVHAEDFYAHFDSGRNDLHLTESNIMYKLNKLLPNDIAIHHILPVKPDAHSRFDAISRSYEYRIHKTKNVFLNDTSWFRYGALDVAKMNEAAELLRRTRDFTSFSKVNTQVKTNICSLKEAVWKEEEGKLIFYITADRFLRNMVRAIVGTLVELGQGKIPMEEFQQIIDNKDRSDAGFSVPAHGLHLTRVIYPEHIFLPVGN